MPLGASKRGNLIVRGRLTKSIKDQIKTLGFGRLVLDHGSWPDLGAFNEKGIHTLHVFGEDIDWDSINSWESIRVLVVHGEQVPRLSLSLLKRLQLLSFPWSDQTAGQLSSDSSVEALKITGSIASLIELPGLNRLKSIQVVQSKKLKRLDGISQFQSLAYAEFGRCPQLVDGLDLEKCKSLEVLKIIQCRSFSDIMSVSVTPGLRELTLDIGEISSLRELGHSKSIELLRFVANVLDGDMSFLLEMPSLRECLFNESKRFNLSKKDVCRRLAALGREPQASKMAFSKFPDPEAF